MILFVSNKCYREYAEEMLRRSRQGWEVAGQLGALAILDKVSREGFTEKRTFRLKRP